LASRPAINVPLVNQLQDDMKHRRTHRFVSSCRIVREDQTVGLVDLEPQQREVLDAWEQHRWIMVVKYRQAKVSTALALALMGMVEYTEAVQGLFIAERYDTAETVWNRASYAYTHQPPETKMPLFKGTTAADRQMRFAHNGTVRVISGGGSAPAIGNSPDAVVVTEYPDVPDHDRFNQHFFPTINKRPNARVAFEHTPGLYASVPHTMWLKALEGKGRFHPVFLKWWLDPSIVPITEDGRRRSCVDLVPTNEELALVEQLPGITKAHLQFRRDSLDTEFHGDTVLFHHKYPNSPYDGWVSNTNPAVPMQAVQWLLARATQVPDHVEHLYEDPEEDQDCPYLITCDPAGWGETGDPSALKVWHGWDRREVLTWSGREDPGLLADRIMRIQKFFGVKRTVVAVESNKGECLSALRAKGCPNLYNHSEHQPGFPASTQTNADALTDLVDLLRHQDIHVRTQATLHQLLAWDGTGRKKKVKSAEGTHHYDQAVVCRIAAYIFRRRPFGSRPAPRLVNRGMTARDLDRMFRSPKQRQVLGIPT
jgi:hypothetical protein